MSLLQSTIINSNKNDNNKDKGGYLMFRGDGVLGTVRQPELEGDQREGRVKSDFTET